MVKRICIICGKEFDTKDRSPIAKTCSKECSLEYRRVYESIRNQKPERKKYKKQHNKQWCQNNPEYHKQRYQNNREHILQQVVQYQDQHPEKYSKTKREEETPGLKEVKKIARQNANYQCELTGWGGPNHVHHLNGYAMFPNQRADLNNLIVLHTDVHKHFHRMYGQKGDNTIDQFDEFVCVFFPLQVDNFRMNKYKYLPEHTYNT